MGNTCATTLSTLEMLDAMEARISALRSRDAGERPAITSGGAAVLLRAELRAAGISAGEFARLARIPRDEIEAWTASADAVPEWVPAALRMIALLTPSARRKLLDGAAHARPANGTSTHPFSRIEDL